ncbi:MAG: hypothetical protein EP309_06025 [Gammaproteobacteria bacterium]|nr:MAG: hypothetical protein EP309_06025 [Gammaproteobacteria bacterium]
MGGDGGVGLEAPSGTEAEPDAGPVPDAEAEPVPVAGIEPGVAPRPPPVPPRRSKRSTLMTRRPFSSTIRAVKRYSPSWLPAFSASSTSRLISTSSWALRSIMARLPVHPGTGTAASAIRTPARVMAPIVVPTTPLALGRGRRQ